MPKLEPEVRKAIAEIGSYEPEEIKQTDRLLEDLAFDSLMIMDLVSTLTKLFPPLGQLSADHPLFQHDLSYAELVVKLGELSGETTEAPATSESGIETMESVVEFNRFLDRTSTVPYFVPHTGVAAAHVEIDGRTLINFASYNYLATNGAERVNKAVSTAIDTYGTSVSASRIIGGEIPLHQELDATIAEFIGAEDAVVQVGGHSTNVNILGNLFTEDDLILHDSLAHNSIVQGALLSQAKRRPFRHNDMAHLASELKRLRGRFRHIVVVVEGVYSMDGDICDLPELVRLKEEHDVFLMIDEAHSFGTLGEAGRGVCSHFGIDPRRVDILMGTLSKSFNSCGGYIAGSSSFIRYLRYSLPGFVFSVGITPANAAAALESIRMSWENPRWQSELHDRAQRLLAGMRRMGLDTGLSRDTAIVPLITKDTARAVELSQRLQRAGVFVAPITYPAVAESEARLRFFVSRGHSTVDIDTTLNALAQITEGQPVA